MLQNPKIVLASSSPYRKTLLERLNLAFETIRPDIDEHAFPGETAENLVLRLAAAKADHIAKGLPNALIIGSDQVAVLGTDLLGKPGNRENARKQLQLMRDQTVNFITGLCVLNSSTLHSQTAAIHYQVIFRDYNDTEIERYLDIDAPFDCAGSFKSEQMGITLMRRMQGDDPTALIGLPLIKLSEMLRNERVNLP